MVTTRSGGEPSGPGERVLLELPLRVVTFLRGVRRSPAVRAALVEGGFTDADHDEGVRLLARACSKGSGSLDLAADRKARTALAFLYEWGTTHLARLRVATLRLHPEHGDLFADLDFSDEATAAVALARWLARIDALGDDGEGVLATLSQRAAGPAERGRLAEQLRIVQSAPFAAPPPNDAEDEATLRALHQWHTDWSTTARAVLKRKDWLILLGLAERRRR